MWGIGNGDLQSRAPRGVLIRAAIEQRRDVAGEREPPVQAHGRASANRVTRRVAVIAVAQQSADSQQPHAAEVVSSGELGVKALGGLVVAALQRDATRAV